MPGLHGARKALRDGRAARNPRHPYPEFRDEFGPHGWSIFRTNGPHGAPRVHGVFCRPFPLACAQTHGFTEHVTAAPEEFRERLLAHVERFGRHAKTCAACARVLGSAALHATGRCP